MEHKHTPGPWHVIDATWDDDGNVRYTLTGIKEAKIADARLIAAAPDLLEALQKAVARQGFSNEELIDARAAIAKATGANHDRQP